MMTKSFVKARLDFVEKRAAAWRRNEWIQGDLAAADLEALAAWYKALSEEIKLPK